MKQHFFQAGSLNEPKFVNIFFHKKLECRRSNFGQFFQFLKITLKSRKCSFHEKVVFTFLHRFFRYDLSESLKPYMKITWVVLKSCKSISKYRLPNKLPNTKHPNINVWRKRNTANIPKLNCKFADKLFECVWPFCGVGA